MSEAAYGKSIATIPRSFPKEDIAVDMREPVALQPLDSAPLHRLGEWAATAICGNDITSSCLYVAPSVPFMPENMRPYACCWWGASFICTAGSTLKSATPFR